MEVFLPRCLLSSNAFSALRSRSWALWASWPIIAMPADTMQKKLKSSMVCWRFATTWMAW